MKLLHTADWHIGQTFYEFDRKSEHVAFFEWLKTILQEQAIDVLLISGDVFDGPNPSAEAQKMYYKFLRDVSVLNIDLQIVIIAGNHDSAARMEAPNPLLEVMNVQVKGVVRRNLLGEIDFDHLLVPLKQKGVTKAWCMAVPYLRSGDHPEAESYGQGVKLMYDHLLSQVTQRCGQGEAIIAMGHLQATGSELMENDRSERTTIGGLDCVSPEAFDARIAYTALGHLHKSQQVSKRENVRYAGSPLPMSFAEKHYKHGVNLVVIDNGAVTNIERILFNAPVKLLSIPSEAKGLSEVMEEIDALPLGEKNETSPYLEIKILITEPEPSLRHQIEERLKDKAVRLARMVSVSPTRSTQNKTLTYEEFQNITPLALALEVFKQKYDNEMPETMQKLLMTVIEEVER